MQEEGERAKPMGIYSRESIDRRASCYGQLACWGFIGTLLSVILLPLGFSKVEYYQGCLKTQKSTGKVDRNRVWKTGNHLIGPDYEFRCFPIAAQNFDQRLAVWTKSSTTDAGSSVTLDISFQYALDPAKLGELYDLVTLDFDSLISTNSIDAIRNTAPLFGVDQYLTERTFIESVFAANVSVAIADLYASVVAMELRDVQLEDDYQAARLAAAIQDESNSKEDYIQQATLVREQTEVEVVEIENDARTVEAGAEAQSLVIVASAEYEARKLVEDARNQGYKQMFDALGLTSEAHKASMDYLVTLGEINVKKTYVHMDPVGTVDVA